MKKSNLLIFLCLNIFLFGCATTVVPSKDNKTNLAMVETNLAIEFVNANDYRNAVDAIEKAINADPTYSYAWMAKGIVYQSIKNYPMAETAYVKALSLDKKRAEINNNYGWFVCHDLKDPKRALVYFDNALLDLTYPTPELAYMNKGICLGNMGVYAEAEMYLNKSVVSNPNFPYPIIELSRLKYYQAQYREAGRYFNAYISMVPNLRSVDLELGYNIASHVGDIKAQNQYLNKLHTQYPYAEETLRLSQ